MSPSTERFVNSNLIALRIAFGLLGLILIVASPVVWDLAGWSAGLATVVAGITALLDGVRGPR